MPGGGFGFFQVFETFVQVPSSAIEPAKALPLVICGFWFIVCGAWGKAFSARAHRAACPNGMQGRAQGRRRAACPNGMQGQARSAQHA
jgi:hypothetical protein